MSVAVTNNNDSDAVQTLFEEDVVRKLFQIEASHPGRIIMVPFWMTGSGLDGSVELLPKSSLQLIRDL
jgi:hypothetical protein